jgi:hypothetical protein
MVKSSLIFDFIKIACSFAAPSFLGFSLVRFLFLVELLVGQFVVFRLLSHD